MTAIPASEYHTEDAIRAQREADRLALLDTADGLTDLARRAEGAGRVVEARDLRDTATTLRRVATGMSNRLVGTDTLVVGEPVEESR